MGLRFQRRLRLFPGVTLNLSKSGVSTTLGVPGASVNLGRRGTTVNAGLPGTGLAYRKRVSSSGRGGNASGDASDDAAAASAAEPELWVPDRLTDIASAPKDELTAPDLTDLRDTLDTALDEYKTRRELRPEVASAITRLRRELTQWQFPLWQWLFTQRIQRLESELREMEELHEASDPEMVSVSMQLAVDDELRAEWQSLVAAFENMADGTLLDVTGEADFSGGKRPGGNTRLETTSVSGHEGSFQLLSTEEPGLHLENANGGDFYLLPGMVLLWDSRGFAVLDMRAIELRLETIDLPLAEPPSDAEQVGERWAYANQDGSPDKRYNDNFRIPLVRLADLWFHTPEGLEERYLVARREAAEAFVSKFQALQQALPPLSLQNAAEAEEEA